MQNKIIYKGDDPMFSQTQKIIEIETNIKDFTGWRGQVIIGNTGYKQEVSAAELADNKIALRYTKNDTLAWQEGFHEIVLKLTDNTGCVKQFPCDTIFEVRGTKND